jgi:hypothetical protein
VASFYGGTEEKANGNHMSIYDLKVGDKIRLTPQRFQEFQTGMSYGIRDPRAIYTVLDIWGEKKHLSGGPVHTCPENRVSSFYENVVKVCKPTIII